MSFTRFLIILPLVLCLSGTSSYGQYNEFGIQLGVANYKGELSPHTFNTDFIHPAFGAFYRHNWNRHWSWKLELNYGRFSGDDAKAKTGFELDRNLSFQSNVLELSPQIEFNFFPYETGNADYPFTPYVFTGIAVFHFNPKADLNGELFELQPLGTEGQGSNGKKTYKRIQLAIPIGGGIKITGHGRLGVGIEVGARRTYTDYLDDVSTTYPDMPTLFANSGPVAVALSDRSYSRADTSNHVPVFQKQRGNSKDKDWYIFAGITIYVRLTSLQKDICRPFRMRRY